MSPRFLLAYATAAILFVTAAAPASAQRRRIVELPITHNEQFTEGGYASRASVPQGGTIDLHIATSISPFAIQIVNLGDESVVLREIFGLQSSAQDCSGLYGTGCGWDLTTTVAIPHDWPSGYYAARFPTRFGTRNIIFVVRPSVTGLTSRTLLVSPTHTYHGYNDFGGRSFYPSNLPGRARTLSYDRPYLQDSGLGRFDFWERKFVDWLEETDRSYEVATDVDLETPGFLNNYELVVIPGHSEYWTSAARQNLETFSRNGGHIAVFGGNTMWWQARLEENNRTIVSFKDADLDPMRSTNPALVTGHWFEHPINNPENFILGSSFRHGGYANAVNAPDDLTLLPVEQRRGFEVTDPTHWVYAGTGLTEGQEFGREAVGVEVDGVLFNCDVNGDVIGVVGSDGTPLNYKILAVTPATDGYGTMGIYVNSAGGAVFNAASQGWLSGLENDPIVRAITANVLDELGSGRAQQYNPVTTTVLTEDRFNCSGSPRPVPGWRANGGAARITEACAYEGPGGLELSGAQSINLARQLTPTGEGRSEVHLRFYVNVDAYEVRNQFPAPIVTLQNMIDTARTQVALVEVDRTNGTQRIRLARRGPDGSFAAGDWIDIGSGWHRVDVTWRSPGTLSIQVDGGTARTFDNPHSGQIANEMVFEYPRSQTGDTGRVCIDAVAAGTEPPAGVAALVSIEN
jgi:hypothetical protein